jgi:hypothetical protein
VNLTSTEGRAVGYLTAYDCAGGFPLASNVNYSPGITTANLATIALAPASRELCIYSSDPTEIVVDLLGWWGTGSGRRALASLASPSRLVDTRQPGSPIARLAPFQPVQIQPPTNRTLYANIAAVGADSGGYVAVYPCAAGWAGTSTVNFRVDVPTANTTWIDASTGVCAFADRSTHLLLDVFAEMTN